MKPILLMFFAVAAFVATSCSEEEDKSLSPIEIELTRSESNALSAVNEFSFDVFKAAEESISNKQPNYTLSPQAYAWTLAMLANGTTDGSVAEKELIEAFHLGEGADINDVNNYTSKLIYAINNSGKYSRVSLSNVVFHNENIRLKSTYLEKLKSFYDVKEFTDHTNTIIDNWIASQTNGMITDFAKQNHLDNHDFGVISNLSFEGLWENPFDPAQTKQEDFRNADLSVSKVAMMSKTTAGKLGKNDFCNMLTLRFRGLMYGITFLIPSEGLTINDIISKMDNNTWEDLDRLTQYNPEIHVKIPRLDLISDIDFIEISKKLGIIDIFDNPEALAKASDDKIFINHTAQATRVKIDEKGAVATSVAEIGGAPLSSGPGHFYLDEPFLFLIKEMTTGAILFMGKVSEL